LQRFRERFLANPEVGLLPPALAGRVYEMGNSTAVKELHFQSTAAGSLGLSMSDSPYRKQRSAATQHQL